MSKDPLIGATSGAIGSLLSTAALYPIDVAKTRVQAGIGGPNASALDTFLEMVKEKGVGGMYRGLPAKSLETVMQSFLYFLAYETAKARATALGWKQSTLRNTVCGVFAGVANLTVTLPLETLVVRIQAEDRAAQAEALSAPS